MLKATRDRSLVAVLLVLLAFANASCSAMPSWLGGTTPQTLDEGIATGYVTLTAANRTFATLVQSKVFSPEDAQSVSKELDNAGLYLRQAKGALANKDPDSAEEYLSLATQILQLVNNELAKRSAK